MSCKRKSRLEQKVNNYYNFFINDFINTFNFIQHTTRGMVVRSVGNSGTDILGHVSKSAAVASAANVGEINLDDDCTNNKENDDGNANISTVVTNVEMKYVPAGVFGVLAASGSTTSDGSQGISMSALVILQASKAASK